MNKERSRKIIKNVGMDLLREGRTIRIKAHGYSMYPAIKPGAVLIIEPVSIKGKPVVGEILAIKRENGLVVHRLVEIAMKNGTEHFITRGDSNAFPDNPVKIEMIAGRITGSEFTGSKSSADIRIRKSPAFVLNRLRVIWIILLNKIRKL
ncbi:MAG TPA: signal peptidase I [Bacteroidales bacterium]|nr:signal peptidase I [Bacteroidales bacterium]